jgi:hypothetical protein
LYIGGASAGVRATKLARLAQAGVIPTSTSAVVCEVQRHWNHPNNEEYAALFARFAPNYGTVIESFQQAQEVVARKYEKVTARR